MSNSLIHITVCIKVSFVIIRCIKIIWIILRVKSRIPWRKINIKFHLIFPYQLFLLFYSISFCKVLTATWNNVRNTQLRTNNLHRSFAPTIQSNINAAPTEIEETWQIKEQDRNLLSCNQSISPNYVSQFSPTKTETEKQLGFNADTCSYARNTVRSGDR